MLIDVRVTIECRGRSKISVERSIDHTDDGAAVEVQDAIAAAIKHLQRQPREVPRNGGAAGDDR